ncbi:MAG: DUF3817 domain-containing protein [Rhodobacterales bacterium]|nr:DUF3817 domain-containing protein [Rhodobacterales bacterium]
MDEKMNTNTTVNRLKWLKIAALFEGSSLITLLFIAMPFKYLLEMPKAVSIVGAAHGTLFLIFVVTLWAHLALGRINIKKTGVGMIASFIPFGTFVYSEKCLRNADA